MSQRIHETNMDYPTAFGIIALAALIHASFQLSISMVTLLSGHSIGSKASLRRTTALVGAFFGGALTMTMLIVSFLTFLTSAFLGHKVPALLWTLVCAMMVGLGVAVWAFYYRRGQGTTLWIPRPLAAFLSERTKATKLAAEAFSLGLVSVIGEFVFVLPLSAAAALTMVSLPTHLQPAGLTVYTLVASLSLGIVVVLITSGHRLSRIQKWREDNKLFLQFAAGTGLLILGAYMYVNEVMAVAAAQGGL